MAYSYLDAPHVNPGELPENHSLERVERQLRTLSSQLCPQPKATLMNNAHNYALDAPSGKEQRGDPNTRYAFQRIVCLQVRTFSDFNCCTQFPG